MSAETTETFADIGIPVNPFPGLRPFEFDESHLFFGRDGQSEQLISKLGRTHFLAVVGTSGSGKSSLVRAGLLPSLLGGFMTRAGSNWRFAIMRPGNDPIGKLAITLNAPDVFGSEIEENAALQRALTEATLQRGSRGLVDAVRQAVVPEYENLLVVVDQFEEIFRLARVAKVNEYQNEAAAFVKLILEASRQREVPIYAVLTMRSDYIGDCSQFWELPEAINESQYLIPRLNRDQLREAITGPIAVAHGEITPRLVARLLNDVGDNQDQLPVLQHLLMRVWDEWKEKRLDVEVKAENVFPDLQHNLVQADELKADLVVDANVEDANVKKRHKEVHQGTIIDLCCYEAVGGMAHALSRHADEAFEELSASHRKLAEGIFKCLTEKGADNREVRRPLIVRELCAVTEADEIEVIDVIETFRKPGRSFLMPPADTKLDSESLIDISHESLIRNWKGKSDKEEEWRLFEWVEDEARYARAYRRLAETAVLHERGEANLWRDPDLQIALDWRNRIRPNQAWAQRYDPNFEEAMKFLEDSRAEREKEVLDKEKELKQTSSFAAILLAALSISSKERERAIEQQRIAEEQEARSRQLLYVANMNLAQQAYEAANIARMRELLDLHLPTLAAPGQHDARSFAWYYFWRFCHNELARFQGHAGSVSSVALSPDGKTLATASSDRTVKLWDTITRQNIATLKGHTGAIESIAFSPDGKTLASASNDRTLRLWDTTTHQELVSLKGHSSNVRAVAFSHDGKIVASGGSDKTVKLWDTSTRLILATLKGRLGSLRSLAFSPDDEILATGGKNQSVELWETEKHEALPRLRGHAGSVSSVTFSFDNKVLATGSVDSTVKLWNPTTRKELVTLKGHWGAVRSIAFSHDGQMLATCGDDWTVKLWDAKTYQELTTFVGHTDSVLSVAYLPDSKTLVTGSSDKTAILWDANVRQKWGLLAEFSSTILSLAFSPDSKTLAIITGDLVVQLWNVFECREQGALKLLIEPDSNVSFFLNNVLVMELRSPNYLKSSFSLFLVAFSPGGETLAIANQKRVSIWDTKLRQELTTLEHKPLPRGMNVSGWPVLNQDVEAPFLESDDDEAPWSHWSTVSLVVSVAFSPDGNILATGCSDGTVKLWETGTGQEPATLFMENDFYSSPCAMPLAFSPDGRTFAAGRQKTAKIWETNSRQELITFEIQPDVQVISFSPDSTVLVTGSNQRIAKVWDPSTGKELAALKGHEGAIRCMAFSPDGKTLATSSDDSTVRLWDTATWRENAALRGHSSSVVAVAFSHDGKTLVTGSDDKTVKLWFAATDEEVAAQRTDERGLESI